MRAPHDAVAQTYVALIRGINVGRAAATRATTRNWATVKKLEAML